MVDQRIRILAVEDNPDYTEVLRQIFTGGYDSTDFQFACASTLSAGCDFVAAQETDAILLDLNLPDSRGLDTFFAMTKRAPGVPIVILTSVDDNAAAVEAIRNGAQDYLLKDEVDGRTLSRVMRFAIERKAAIYRVELIDTLTGLYSWSGFRLVAEQQMRLASRTQRGFLLLLVTVRGLRTLNERFGAQEGDLALMHAAEVLKGTYRKSDIIARLGGNELALLAIDAPAETLAMLMERLQANLAKRNAQKDRRWALSLAVGSVYLNPQARCSLEELTARARDALSASPQILGSSA